MEKERAIIVSDSHGCVGEVEDLIAKVAYDPNKDRLISLGDMVDRGTSSIQTVRLFRRLGAEVVASNHDGKIPRFFAHELAWATTGKKNPMSVSDARRAEWLEFEPDDVAWLASFPPWIHIPELNLLCVHGGFENFPLARQNPKTVTLVRYVDKAKGTFQGFHGEVPPATLVPWYEAFEQPYSCVAGHNVVSLKDPYVHEKVVDGKLTRRYSIDCGCCFGGRLTAAVFTTADNDLQHSCEFVQVDARKKYWELKGNRN